MTTRWMTTLLGFLLGVGFAFVGGPVLAAVDCNNPGLADADQDGLSNAEECNGLVADGVSASITIGSCRDTPQPCLDPDKKDLFIVVIKSTANPFGTSALDEPAHAVALTDLFEPMRRGIAAGGLDMQTHVLTSSPSLPQCTRCITPDQAATVISENRTERANSCPSDPPRWGEASWGNPNEGGAAIVYSQRILDGIECFVNGLPSPGAVNADQLKRDQLVNTFNHEAAHLIRLAEQDDRKVGHHYPLGASCIADVSPVYEVNRKGVVTIVLGQDFCGPSQTMISAGATADGSGALCGDFSDQDFDPPSRPKFDCLPVN